MLSALKQTFHLLIAPAYLDSVDSPYSSVFQCPLLDPARSPLSLTPFKGTPLMFIHGSPDDTNIASLSHDYPHYTILFTPNRQNIQKSPYRTQSSHSKEFKSHPSTLSKPGLNNQRDVTGPETSPLYRYLRRNGPGFDASVGHASPLRDSFGIFVCDRLGRVRTYARSKQELSQELMKKIEEESFSEKEYQWLLKPYK